ncbi:NAD-dependent epimerase/dehydratase family protein [Siphonobacter curvatus]|uniref:Epimerase n=1 Tax=Siphonobacter curvatus TaxID=2094562 RepID=A0A2S7IRB4_9BACT|nr:NAD-dependent epimerase/dehydratase family protein [Siphonobacter curvatus]PQA60120.1 epimerase [Siphonobacter curvatus]
MKKIFITGATGYIGGSIARVLLEKGYEITALVRKASAAEELKALGITPVIGHLHNLKLLREEARQADAVINTADADDVHVVATFLEALEGTGKTFIHTSGSSLVGDKSVGQRSDVVYHEDVPLEPRLEKAQRVVINDTVLKAAQRGIRSIVIVPTMIYGAGLGLKKDSIQVPMLMDISREKQAGVHIEAGENIWSNVHMADLAELYWLALENAPAGSYYYAENGEAALKDIAVSISKKLGFGGKTVALPIDEAIERWGPDASSYGLASNSRVDATKARKTLGWQPKYASILTDIEG